MNHLSRHFVRLAGFATLAFLAACTSREPSVASHAEAEKALRFAPENAVVITVNGEAISEAMLARFARGRGLDLENAAQRQQALDLVLETLLLAQDAIAEGFLSRPDLRTELDLARIQVLAARNLADARAGMNLSDEQLREFYTEVTARTGTQELHLRNVLFADEASAVAAAAQAVASPDFATWMRGMEGRADVQVRDLGWANPTQLPPELAQAANALADGAASPTPVQTRFGWHVFQRVASRPFTPPAFEDVRDGIRKQAGDKHLEEKISVLRARAKISPDRQ